MDGACSMHEGMHRKFWSEILRGRPCGSPTPAHRGLPNYFSKIHNFKIILKWNRPLSLVRKGCNNNNNNNAEEEVYPVQTRGLN
jgi:hypothetical protein